MAQETTPPLVAQQATQTTNDLGGTLTLLGTFGSQTNLQALLKLRGGTIATVSRGDLVNGQTVVAIEDGRVALARNGTAHWLEMPAPTS
jgi:type IV pilus biogenesis protein PilP